MSIRSARRACLPAALCLAGAAFSFGARAQSATLVAAGSLNLALSDVAQNFNAATGITVAQTFGPSGTVRSEIEGGLKADVFASADTTRPAALQQEGIGGPVQEFAHNQIVAVFRSNFGRNVSPGDLLNVLLDPSVKIGTSTPVADPLGDYTQQIFERADAIMPGTAAALEGKRVELVANPSAPTVPANANSTVYFLDTTQTVDVFLTYVTGAVQARALDPTLQIVYLPPRLAVPAPFGLTVLNGASAAGREFARYILSAPGQRILASYGFIPVCLPWQRHAARACPGSAAD